MNLRDRDESIACALVEERSRKVALFTFTGRISVRREALDGDDRDERKAQLLLRSDRSPDGASQPTENWAKR